MKKNKYSCHNYLIFGIAIPLTLFYLQLYTINFVNGQKNDNESFSSLLSSSNTSSLLSSKSTISTTSSVENFQEILKPKIHLSIKGTAIDDTIKAGGGNDKIEGGKGDDIIRGESGDDKIDGEEGDDMLIGGLGNNTVDGGDGNDVLNGERGEDELDGGDGNDKIKGGRGDDKIDGGEGFDILTGGLGADMFICDEFDQITDFNLREGDEKKGSCIVEDVNNVNPLFPSSPLS